MTPTERKQSSAKQQVVSLLRDLASQIQAMDDAVIESVLAGRYRLEIRPPEKKSRRQQPRLHCSDEDITRLQRELRTTDTREQARQLIDDILHTKAELIRFARALDIPVPKSASVEQVKDRLVESTVGYRLRSAAIRGNVKL